MDSRLSNYTKSPIPVLNNISPHNYVMLPALLSNFSESASPSSSSSSLLQSSSLRLSVPSNQPKLLQSNQSNNGINNKNNKFSREIIYTAKRIQLNNQQLSNFYNFQHQSDINNNKNNLQSTDHLGQKMNYINKSSLEDSLNTLTNSNNSLKFINEAETSNIINTDSFVNYYNNTSVNSNLNSNDNNNDNQIDLNDTNEQDEEPEEKNYTISCPVNWQFNIKRMLNCGVYIKKLLKNDYYNSKVKLVCSVCQLEFFNLKDLAKHKEKNANCLNNINIINNRISASYQQKAINEAEDIEDASSLNQLENDQILIRQKETSSFNDTSADRSLLLDLIVETEAEEIDQEEYDFEDFINDESNDINDDISVKKKACTKNNNLIQNKKLRKKPRKCKKVKTNNQTDEESYDLFSKLISPKDDENIVNEEGKNDAEDDDFDEESLEAENSNKQKRKYIKNKPTSEVAYNCEKCNKICRTKAELLVHIHKHSGKEAECWQCGKKCASFSNLVSHVQLHTGEKPYSCQFCNKQFTQDAHLTRHLRLHTGERPFVCNICGKNYKDYSYYKTHLRIHRGERLYKCQYCNKEYYDASYYKKHTRLHTGEKPYMCTVCGRQFHRSDYLKLHSFSHTDERPFSCHICGKGFKMKYNLKTHLKTHENTTTTAKVNYDLIDNQEDQETNHMNHMITPTTTSNNQAYSNSIQTASINLNLNDPKFNSIVTTTNEIVTYYIQDVDLDLRNSIHQIN